MSIIPDVEQQGFTDKEAVVIRQCRSIIIGGKAHNAEFDKPITMIGLQREGDLVVAEIPLALFLTAADALKAQYGDPRPR